MSDIHEKLAAALDALSAAWTAAPTTTLAQPQVRTKNAADTPHDDLDVRYRRLTGESLDVGDDPRARAALAKLAAAASTRNDLGEPAGRDPRAGPPPGATREERIKAAFDGFGHDLLNAPATHPR